MSSRRIMTDQQIEEISERIAQKYENKEDKHNCGPWYRSAIQDFIKETEAFYERDLAQARAELEGVTRQRNWRVKEGIILGNAMLAISNKPHSPEVGDVIQSAVEEIKALQALQRIEESLPAARSAEGARG